MVKIIFLVFWSHAHLEFLYRFANRKCLTLCKMLKINLERVEINISNLALLQSLEDIQPLIQKHFFIAE